MLGDVSTPEAVERERRSVTMLPTRTPVYDRDEALVILEALASALAELSGDGAKVERDDPASIPRPHLFRGVRRRVRNPLTCTDGHRRMVPDG